MIGAVENGEIFPFLELRALGDLRACAQRLDASHSPLRFVLFVVSIHYPNRLAFAQIAPELLGKELGIGADHIVGCSENSAGGAVVLLQLDHFERRKIKRQPFQVVQRCAAPAVDRLIVVAHGGKARLLAHHALEQLILHRIGILVFVNEDMCEFFSPNLRSLLTI